MRWSILLFVLFISCTDDYIVPSHVPGVVKVEGNAVFTAYGDGGLFITNATTDAVIAQIFPPRQMNGIDDFAIDGDLLFVLDARSRNYLAVFSIANLSSPKLLEGPIEVEGGPFNGVSARSGNLVVSGGSSYLDYMQYSSSGELSGSGNFERDRGHPDVILSENGRVAFASTDFNKRVDGSRFGMLALWLGSEVGIPTIISEIGLPEAGFTEGLTSPVGFPIQADLYNDHLLIAHGGGLKVIELIDQAGFGTSQDMNLGFEANTIDIFGDVAFMLGYASENNPVLVELDINDPFTPIITSTTSLDIGSSIPTSVSANSQFVFVAAGEAGLLKINR